MTNGTLEDARRALDAGGRILVTRLRYIGDVILSLPLVHALRVAFPHAELHYLAERPAVDILRHHPDVDRAWTLEHGARAAWRMAHALRRQRFDAVVDLLSNPRSALMTRMSGARVRIGEKRRVRRHLYTHARQLPRGRSALQQHLDVAALLGAPSEARAPRLYLSPEERARGRDHVRRQRVAGPRVVLHLAATQPEKEWPVVQAAAFAKQLVEADHAVLLSTAPHRPQPSERVHRLEPRARRLPTMPLRELFGVLAAADAVVGVDGGIVHASVALERPTLALFGPTDATIWFPYADFGAYRVLRRDADCPACRRSGREHRCMHALAAAEVAETFRGVLAQARTARGAASR